MIFSQLSYKYDIIRNIMKILRIESSRQIFKSSNDDLILGYDDNMSKERRSYIREHYTSYSVPHYKTIENNGRLDEYKLDSLIKTLFGKNTSLQTLRSKTRSDSSKNIKSQTNPDLMKTFPGYNITFILGSNSYRGGTTEISDENIGILKQAGIKSVICLVDSNLSPILFENYGIEFYRFPFNTHIFEQDAFKTKNQVISETKKLQRDILGASEVEVENAIRKNLEDWQGNKEYFIKKFIKFIQIMQKGNVYIGCEFGTYNTDNALMLNHFFNPDAAKTPDCISCFNVKSLLKLKNLYRNLDDNSKLQLGWNEDFDSNFLPRLKRVVDSYNKFYKFK